jgi:hypothetical protein
MKSKYNRLLENNLIEESQFEFLNAIETNKIISLFKELRLMLYLGIMLLTTGIGYFAYQNMGKIGHILCMTLIFLAIVACFYYILKFASPYTNNEVKVLHPFFDYVLILTSLLMIGLFSYIQVYFSLVQLLLNWSTLISAVVLLFMAYRYDNRGLLSMGITAFSATFGIIISPVNWTKGEWLPSIHLYNTGIVLGIVFVLIGQVSELKKIKSHFRFTYQNAGLLILFIAGIAAIFDSNYPVLYALFLMVISGIVIYVSWNYKEFLFFLYSSISAYVAITYLLIKFVEKTDAWVLLFYYFPISCVLYILFLHNKKNHFSNE